MVLFSAGKNTREVSRGGWRNRQACLGNKGLRTTNEIHSGVTEKAKMSPDWYLDWNSNWAIASTEVLSGNATFKSLYLPLKAY